tara:strand:+ start:567 stop:689 length:123 start_codon:yes stop_codon:yes gene_type:complete
MNREKFEIWDLQEDAYFYAPYEDEDEEDEDEEEADDEDAL